MACQVATEIRDTMDFQDRMVAQDKMVYPVWTVVMEV